MFKGLGGFIFLYEILYSFDPLFNFHRLYVVYKRVKSDGEHKYELSDFLPIHKVSKSARAISDILLLLTSIRIFSGLISP